jgi:phosphatidylserine/phosphatidylglycerophosphate/cardiolipin synthase-like enzyme
MGSINGTTWLTLPSVLADFLNREPRQRESKGVRKLTGECPNLNEETKYCADWGVFERGRNLKACAKDMSLSIDHDADSDTTATTALKRLKAKWFITTSTPISLLSSPGRHAGSLVAISTDGNLVTPLIDGETYMSQWADSLAAMSSRETLRSQLFHTGLSLDNVAVRGKTKGGWAALDLIEYANRRNNVEIFGMVSDHGYYGNAENRETVDWLFQHGVYNVRRDPRYPNLAAGGLCCGSNHQKFACLGNPSNRHALLGSADIHSGRWDTAAHASPNSDRPGKPTHEVGVMIQGPAVVDVETTFLERWNDSSRTRLLPDKPFPPVLSGQYGLPPPKFPSSPTSGATVRGTHSVQVLHTYGRTSRGYSWSDVGEFTIWASYLNAILRATSYIYIEDQYFMPFGFPPVFQGPPGSARNSDLIFQLGEAIRRGVKVLVVVPTATEEKGLLPKFQKYQRDIGVDYLNNLPPIVGPPGNFAIAALHNGTEDIYVHSKLMIIDDEFVLLGSANVNQKSMTHDSELDVGIVDADGMFARDLRKALWAEHLSTDLKVVDDPMIGYGLMYAAATKPGRTGHLIPYNVQLSQPFGHKQAIARIDPYAGPPR